MIVYIAGTGTDVGKTHVTAALARASGLPAWKPVVSGGLEDVERLGARAPLVALGEPISPHLAARREGVTLSARAIVDATRARVSVIVESAGGLYSPLSDTETNADVARLLGERTKLVLVAPDRLGVLHDVGACARAARADGLSFAAVVLSAPAAADASTGTNAAELVRLGLAREVVYFPRASLDDPATQDAATALFKILC
jgi:dethiobiotin synthetase